MVLFFRGGKFNHIDDLHVDKPHYFTDQQCEILYIARTVFFVGVLRGGGIGKAFSKKAVFILCGGTG